MPAPQMTSSERIVEYFSQNAQTCGTFKEKACAVVSLANALRRLVPPALKPPTPLEIIQKCTKNDLFDSGGISPLALNDLCKLYQKDLPGLTVDYIAHPTAQARNLARGALMYVNSVALLNAQGVCQYETSTKDNSHVVFVEDILEDGTVVVINPDRAQEESGSGFSKSQWGRMRIPQPSLESVWQSVRFDGNKTTRCAICLVI